MILVDTNIVSEFMTSTPDDSVLYWLNEQDTLTLHLSTISIAEISYGLRVMRHGKRKTQLQERFNLYLELVFEDRILAFDERAARIYGEILGHRRQLGRPMSSLDGQIAAIARSRGLRLATRNTKDFTDCRLDLVNPFAGGK